MNLDNGRYLVHPRAILFKRMRNHIFQTDEGLQDRNVFVSLRPYQIDFIFLGFTGSIFFS